MYNSAQKNRFMDSIGLGNEKRSWAVVIFESTGSMENQLNKDIAMFSAEETGDALCSSGVSSSITLSNRIPFIVRYKKWCMDNGLDAVVVKSSEIVCDLSDNIRNTMVCSPAHLKNIVDRAFPDTEGFRSMAPVYRAYLWFAFSGMYEEDAVQVRGKDLNLRDCVVSVRGRWYEIPKEGVPDIRLAAKLDALDRKMSDGTVRVYQRADGDAVIRGRKLKKELPPAIYVTKTLRQVVHHAMSDIGMDGVSYLRVQKSGLFYAMMKREVHGFAPNFYTIACDDYDRVTHKNVTQDIRQRTIHRYNMNYGRDYAAWKKAFREELVQEFELNDLP